MFCIKATKDAVIGVVCGGLNRSYVCRCVPFVFGGCDCILVLWHCKTRTMSSNYYPVVYRSDRRFLIPALTPWPRSNSGNKGRVFSSLYGRNACLFIGIGTSVTSDEEGG